MMNKKELRTEEMNQVNGGTMIRIVKRDTTANAETAQVKTTSVNQASEDTSGITVGSLFR